LVALPSGRNGAALNLAKETYMFIVEDQQTASDEIQENPKAPTHIAYQVREGKEGKNFWNRVGIAWAHKDGKGFSIQLDAVPLDGSISLRTAKEKKPE
jgi:hypothetical protein